MVFQFHNCTLEAGYFLASHFGALNQISPKVISEFSDKVFMNSVEVFQMFQCCCGDQNQVVVIGSLTSVFIIFLYIKFNSLCNLIYKHDFLTISLKSEVPCRLSTPNLWRTQTRSTYVYKKTIPNTSHFSVMAPRLNTAYNSFLFEKIKKFSLAIALSMSFL